MFGLEFGFKGDTNRVSGRAKKDKPTVPGEQLIYFVGLSLAKSAEGLQFLGHELDFPFLFQAVV